MHIYVIYKNPSDYPNKFVVRKWWLNKPQKDVLRVSDTLEDARGAIPEGMALVPRLENDDAVIYETYL